MHFTAFIEMNPDDLKGHAVDGDKFSDGGFIFKQLLFDQSSDGGDFAGPADVKLIDQPALYENGIFKEFVIRVKGDDIKGAVFFFVGDQVRIPQVIAGANVLNPFQVGFNFVIVRIGKFNPPSRLQAFIGFAGLPGMDPDAVGGQIAKLVFNPVFDAGSRSQQQNEHENTPGDAESGQHRAQLVFVNGTEDFMESIDEMQHWFST